jgi:ubiquinone/menaquinone biosynthesis C-methylase UbiE
MKISFNRWQQAQAFEFNDWQSQPQIVANEWQEAFQKYHRLFRRLASTLKIKSDSRILDIGCSLTCVSRLFPQGQRFGVEPLAEKLNIDSQVPGVKVIKGVGEHLPFDDNYFDLSLCRNVLDHTHDPNQVLGEAYRTLKPQGYFILAVYTYNPFIALVKNLGEKISFFRNVGHPHTYTPASLQNLAATHFKVISHWTIYQGTHPQDFGKVNPPSDPLPLVQKIVLFINRNLFRYSWFVRETCLLCQKV